MDWYHYGGIVRGVTVISSSRRSFDMLLGCGVLAMLGIQTFMIVGGVIKMLPLTGVTFPFISNGGSSMIGAWGLLAFIKAADTRQDASIAIPMNRR